MMRVAAERSQLNECPFLKHSKMSMNGNNWAHSSTSSAPSTTEIGSLPSWPCVLLAASMASSDDRADAPHLETLLGQVKQEGLGRRDPPLPAIVPDGDHLAKDMIIGDLASTVPRATVRIAAFPLLELRVARRLAIPERNIAHWSVPAQRSVPGSWTIALISTGHGSHPGVFPADSARSERPRLQS